jgi:hypothetical protein
MESNFLAGLTPFDEFARAIGKHPKTVRKMRPPRVKIGRTQYVPDDEGKQWILDGCPPVMPATSSRRRRRAA